MKRPASLTVSTSVEAPVSLDEIPDRMLIDECLRRGLIGTDRQAVANAARALLERIETITTEEFRLGAERAEREALADALSLPLAA